MNASTHSDYLYRSDTIAVRRVACRNRKRWVITFDNYGIGAGFDRPGFGEQFLKKEGISAIHMLGRGNDWYQYPDALAACAVARDAIDPDARRVTYGSSMGGYAALRFADALGANEVLALSPQYSNDLAVVPWEARWQQDARRIHWLPELSGPIRCRAKPVILYDPTGPDRRQIDLIARDVPSTLVAIPYGGHPVATYLVEAGLVRPILRRLFKGEFDPAAIQRRIRNKRASNTTYLAELALRQPRSRPKLAISLARTAVAANPKALLASRALALALARNGQTGEALKLHAQTVERSHRDPLYLIGYAEALIAAGDSGTAIAIAREVVESQPDAGHLRHWLGWVLSTAGDLEAAIAQEKIAIELMPYVALFRNALARYEAQSKPLSALATGARQAAAHIGVALRKSLGKD